MGAKGRDVRRVMRLVETQLLEHEGAAVLRLTELLGGTEPDFRVTVQGHVTDAYVAAVEAVPGVEQAERSHEGAAFLDVWVKE